MPLSPPLAKMTRAQLEARIEFHESTAEQFAISHEDGQALQFRELAQKYRAELDTRPPDPPRAPRPALEYRRPA